MSILLVLSSQFLSLAGLSAVRRRRLRPGGRPPIKAAPLRSRRPGCSADGVLRDGVTRDTCRERDARAAPPSPLSPLGLAQIPALCRPSPEHKGENTPGRRCAVWRAALRPPRQRGPHVGAWGQGLRSHSLERKIKDNLLPQGSRWMAAVDWQLSSQSFDPKG